MNDFFARLALMFGSDIELAYYTAHLALLLAIVAAALLA